MKRNEFESLKNLSLLKLKERLHTAYKERADARLAIKVGKIKDVHLVNKKNKEIAKILTLIRLKEISEKE